MSCFYNSAKTAMKFSGLKADYTGANGVVYSNGDFKPVWQAVQNRLNFTINDLTDSSKGSVDAAFTTQQPLGFKTTDGTQLNISQGNSSAIIKEGTANKTILDLSQYMDKLPNFKNYLDNNTIIKKQISDSNGAIYYAPYFDGADDMEKTLLLRKGWVENLLDGDYTAASFDTARTITTGYTTYNSATVDQDVSVLNADNTVGTIHKKYTAGNDIITLQNALATKNGASLVKAFRDYIDATYNNAYGTTRSALFIGGKAAFNIDELVALYRCVKTNPTLLTGSDKELWPLMPREYTNDRISDLWNFMLYFGCRGFNSRQTYYYRGDDGKLVDIRTTSTFTKAMEEYHAMYNEGLVLKDFDKKTGGGTTEGKFENAFLKATDNDIGFSEYDYVQTQTILNDSNSKLELVPTMPASYAWRDGKESRYTDSWRSVKTQGWFITAATASDPKVLDRCLTLFDYFWGTEGSTLMSYGPDAWVDGTTSYMGRTIPKLSAACLNELKTLTAGNYTDYYRQYLGGTFPIGYIKEQGMEYQTVNELARGYLDIVENALAQNVVAHPNFKSDNTDKMQDILPTTLPFTSGELTDNTQYSALTTYFSTDKGKVNGLTNFLKSGFVDSTNSITDAASYLTYITNTLANKGLGINEYDANVEAAYQRYISSLAA
jgi:hypothetical protein